MTRYQVIGRPTVDMPHASVVEGKQPGETFDAKLSDEQVSALTGAGVIRPVGKESKAAESKSESKARPLTESQNPGVAESLGSAKR